jgi:hypothetical protein
VRTEGEKYREGLKRLVRELDLEDNVIFLDRFLDLDDLAPARVDRRVLHPVPARRPDRVGRAHVRIAAGSRPCPRPIDTQRIC